MSCLTEAFRGFGGGVFNRRVLAYKPAETIEVAAMLTIGTLARKTGTKVQTIRYYEQIGLLPEPGRSAGGQRRYLPKDQDRLAFVRHARQLGFSLDAIRELLDLADNPHQSCAGADSIAQRQLKQVEQRLDRLKALQQELKRMIGECSGDRVADCRVLEVLRDHAECLTDHNGIGA
jgi:Cu(I)-responsive transcriptional regulator